MPYLERDIKMDSEGDLVVGSNGDLVLATERETLETDVLLRLRADHLDWGIYPYLGANLHALVGEPNNRRTADLATEQAHISLTQDNRVRAGTLLVESVPIATDKLLVLCVIQDQVGAEAEPTIVSATLDLSRLPTEESILDTAE